MSQIGLCQTVQRMKTGVRISCTAVLDQDVLRVSQASSDAWIYSSRLKPFTIHQFQVHCVRLRPCLFLNGSVFLVFLRKFLYPALLLWVLLISNVGFITQAARVQILRTVLPLYVLLLVPYLCSTVCWCLELTRLDGEKFLLPIPAVLRGLFKSREQLLGLIQGLKGWNQS